jgi:putative ABC transport system permease protein
MRAIETFLQDFRYALRTLRKSAGFTVVAVLVLALGIGVNSAIFSVVEGVMLQPLPYPEPGRLVSLWETLTREAPADWHTSGANIGGPAGDKSERMTVAPANLLDYTRQNHVFSGMAGIDKVGKNLTESGPPERIFGEQVTASFFTVLGVQPSQGRAFTSEEDRPGANRVVILSHDLWQQRFASDPRLIGSTLKLDGEKFTVIGVMPAGFRSPEQFGMTDRLQFFVPAAYPANLLASHGDHEVAVIARLAPGASVRQAQAELDSISGQLAQAHPASNRGIRAVIAPLGEDIVRNVRSSLWILFGAVSLILLIACSNVANLLLVRAVGRQREISIRFALGASRLRVVRELVTQSAALTLMGLGAGMLFGAWTERLLVSLAPVNIPRLGDIALNLRVVAFTSILSLATGILFGVLPAWQVSKARPSESLKTTARNLAGSSVMRWRSILMMGELALSMILLTGAGLLLKSFILLRGVDLGFEPEHVLAMNINLPETVYSDANRRFAYFDQLAEGVSRLPGVQSVAFANRMPMRGGWGGGLRVESSSGEVTGEADFQAVNPGYFQTLGIPIRQGRALASSDRTGSAPAAVVNMAFVRRFLSNEDALGRRFRRSQRDPWINIVGIAGDVRRGGKAAPLNPQVYLAAAQTTLYPVRLADFAVRAAGDPRVLLMAIQKQVWAIDKDQPVTNVKTLDEVISDSVAQRRFQMLLLLLFAGLALFLALVGVYGVAGYSVSQRTAEIGVRIALGAQGSDILLLVLRQTMLVVGGGIAIGAAGAYYLSRYIASLLFSVKPSDPLTYLALAMLLIATTLVACYIPARRACAVDPTVALRYE